MSVVCYERFHGKPHSVTSINEFGKSDIGFGQRARHNAKSKQNSEIKNSVGDNLSRKNAQVALENQCETKTRDDRFKKKRRCKKQQQVIH